MKDFPLQTIREQIESEFVTEPTRQALSESLNFDMNYMPQFFDAGDFAAIGNERRVKIVSKLRDGESDKLFGETARFFSHRENESRMTRHAKKLMGETWRKAGAQKLDVSKECAHHWHLPDGNGRRGGGELDSRTLQNTPQ